VIELVQDVEANMVDMIRISGVTSSSSAVKQEPDLPGPVVPGVDDTKDDVAKNQDDVDDLLSSLGF
jgi:chemotaxis protein CheZ